MLETCVSFREIYIGVSDNISSHRLKKKYANIGSGRADRSIPQSRVRKTLDGREIIADLADDTSQSLNLLSCCDHTSLKQQLQIEDSPSEVTQAARAYS